MATRHHDVAGLDVAVHDVPTVDVLEHRQLSSSSISNHCRTSHHGTEAGWACHLHADTSHGSERKSRIPLIHDVRETRAEQGEREELQVRHAHVRDEGGDGGVRRDVPQDARLVAQQRSAHAQGHTRLLQRDDKPAGRVVRAEDTALS